MGFVRFFGLFLLILLGIYFALSIWLRLGERRRLAEEWELGPQDGDREDFMATGMAEYDRSLRKKLLWGVIVLPMAGLMLLLYLLNVS